MRAPIATLVVLAAAALIAAGCGSDSNDKDSAKRSIPQSLKTVQSSAEDTTRLVLAGKRADAVKSADALKSAADGQAADDLADADVPAVQIAELKARAATVTEIVARGRPIDVALAANRVFELVPDFFEVYSSRVPSEVTRLDYLESEARLQALADDRGRVVDAVSAIDVAWKVLGKQVVRAGGDAPAKEFDAHLRAIDALVKTGAGTRALEREAQHGLDLVDELAAVYAG